MPLPAGGGETYGPYTSLACHVRWRLTPETLSSGTVAPSVAFSGPALSRLGDAQARWARALLGWPTDAPAPAALWDLGWLPLAFGAFDTIDLV